MKTEQEMRDEKIPDCQTEAELIQYIHDNVEREHDYGTCVYAMSNSAVAVFNYVASKLGVTGFQASCADLDILRHTRNWKAGRILDYEKLLYPQYCNSDEFPSAQQCIEENKEWLSEEARKKLKETDMPVSPNVLEHWKMLAGLVDEK